MASFSFLFLHKIKVYNKFYFYFTNKQRLFRTRLFVLEHFFFKFSNFVIV